DNTFDCVICSATRKHVRDSAALMREIARVLKPAGRAVVIDPHPFLLWVGRWIGKFDPRYLFHLSSADDVAREMKAAGLKAVSRSTNIFISCVGEKQAERVLENP
ncbi:MAG: class I SAM-dependent methyltransferase, partial [Terriglobia bacterium]